MSSAPQQLVDWLTEVTGALVHLAEPPRSNGDGFDSEVYFVRLEGDGLDEAWLRPLVLRIKPGADQLEVARHEAGIQDWAADRGYPTPRVLEVFVPGAPFERPAQVMERAPGRIALDTATRRPWKARAIIEAQYKNSTLILPGGLNRKAQ